MSPEPIQFEMLTDHLAVCTLCGAAVPSSLRWQEVHRQKHNEHNELHEALRSASAHRPWQPEPKMGR